MNYLPYPHKAICPNILVNNDTPKQLGFALLVGIVKIVDSELHFFILSFLFSLFTLFYFPFSFSFLFFSILFLEQLRLGFISHTVTSVTS